MKLFKIPLLYQRFCKLGKNGLSFTGNKHPFRDTNIGFFSVLQITCKKSQPISTTWSTPVYRHISSAFKRPNLMNFPVNIFPSVFYIFQNFFFYQFYIQSYFDTQFSLAEFTKGARQALIHSSSLLSRGDLDGLTGLVTPEALTEIRVNLQQFTDNERFQLKIREQDLDYTFVHKIGIIFEEGDAKRFVEIMVVFLAAKYDLPLYSRYTICNYRFIREFTKGVEGEWQINQLNHFRIEISD